MQEEKIPTSIPNPSPEEKLPDPLSLFSQSLALLRKNLLKFLAITLIPYIITFISLFFSIIVLTFLTVVMSKAPKGHGQTFYNSLNSSPSGVIFSPPYAAPPLLVPFFIIATITFLIIIVSYTWGHAAFIFQIMENQAGVIESFSKSKKKVIQLILMSLLLGLIIMAGWFLFVIPGIIFWLWFSLSSIALIAEDLKAIEALKKSKFYVQGRLLAVLGRFLAIFAFFIGLLILTTIPVQLARFLGIKILSFIFLLAQLFLAFLFNPFFTIYSFLIYKNLKNIKAYSNPQTENLTFINSRPQPSV